MSGCLDHIRMPACEGCMELGERRNAIASIVGGSLFFIGWWIIIDMAALYPSQTDFPHAYHTLGVVGTLALFMINAISSGQIHGDIYTSGVLGSRGARIWMLLGFLMLFGILIGSLCILFIEYVVPDKQPQYPGVALFLQNAFIFAGAMVYKFGRTEDI